MELRPLYTLTWTMIFIAVVWMCIDVKKRITQPKSHAVKEASLIEIKPGQHIIIDGYGLLVTSVPGKKEKP